MDTEHSHVGNHETVALQPHHQEEGVEADNKYEDHDDPSEIYRSEDARNCKHRGSDSLNACAYVGKPVVGDLIHQHLPVIDE